MRCYHCTEEVTEPGCWQVPFDNEVHDVCCLGCQAVMQAIVDADLGDYYRFRTEPAQFGVIPDDLSTRLDELAVFDEPEISERYLHQAEASDGSLSDWVEVNLSVEGLRCGACVWVLERSVRALPGVEGASVNFASARATVRFDADRLKLSSILGRIAQVGYRTVPFDVRERELSLRRESRVFLQRLFIAGIAMMQVMMYALPAYISDSGEIEPEYEQLLRWASLILTTPVLLYSAQPFLKGAWNDLRNRAPGMDVPVSIGILAAFSASVWATFTAQGEIYFDSVAMFVFLLLGARYIEWSARRRAIRAVDDISASAPETAQRLVDGEIEVVPSVRLEPGDIVVVSSGERIPVDATVRQGRSAVNNALVTGESVPVTVGPGDIVAGGALLSGAPLNLEVLRRQSASTLSIIDRLIDRGANEKPRAVMLADKIATIFVTVLLCFATLVFAVWMVIDPARAATTAIAVLVVSCPCALSMATPVALAAATGQLLKKRLLITRGHALETLSQVSDVVFDKTGTLSMGQPSVVSVQTASVQAASVQAASVHTTTEIEKKHALALAVALETGSTHPYAQALRAYSASCLSDDASALEGSTMVLQDAAGAMQALGYTVQNIEHEAGHGVRAVLEHGGTLYLGSAQWCGISAAELEQGRAVYSAREQSASEVFLTRHAMGHSSVQVLARFLICDQLRPDADTLVQMLQQRGLKVHLLSGDRQASVAAVATELGIEQWQASATPEGKQEYVAQLQRQGRTVMMVGDGINDAPVLASADVSMAAGDATALARTAADVISLLPGLDGLPMLLSRARKTRRIIRQNLAWAASYNATAIPLAALGFVPPWAAAIGMAASSLLVVANAQRLWADGHDTLVG